jgi:hypothetical protein
MDNLGLSRDVADIEVSAQFNLKLIWLGLANKMLISLGIRGLKDGKNFVDRVWLKAFVIEKECHLLLLSRK